MMILINKSIYILNLLFLAKINESYDIDDSILHVESLIFIFSKKYKN